MNDLINFLCLQVGILGGLKIGLGWINGFRALVAFWFLEAMGCAGELGLDFLLIG